MPDPDADHRFVSPSFDSFSQNGEDVILWRALRAVSFGRYIDVGANDPVEDSVSRAFYERHWSGITVEPDPHYAQRQREQRPRDLLVEAAISAVEDGSATLHVVDGTGLSTVRDDLVKLHAGSGYETHDVTVVTRRLDSILEEAGWAGREIHFMSVDTEGSERNVLESIDLTMWRPWILVIEATAPTSTESTHGEWESIVTGAGYRFCLFDGLSRWYLAEEHGHLLEALSYPACILDNYTTLQARKTVQQVATLSAEMAEKAESARSQVEIDALVAEVVRWRSLALHEWAATAADKRSITLLQKELERLADAHRILQGEHHELSQLCHQFSLSNAELHERIAAFNQSTSWRLTEPIRAIGGRLERIRHRP